MGPVLPTVKGVLRGEQMNISVTPGGRADPLVGTERRQLFAKDRKRVLRQVKHRITFKESTLQEKMCKQRLPDGIEKIFRLNGKLDQCP